jgi:hypothetical protein
VGGGNFAAGRRSQVDGGVWPTVGAVVFMLVPNTRFLGCVLSTLGDALSVERLGILWVLFPRFSISRVWKGFTRSTGGGCGGQSA